MKLKYHSNNPGHTPTRTLELIQKLSDEFHTKLPETLRPQGEINVHAYHTTHPHAQLDPKAGTVHLYINPYSTYNDEELRHSVADALGRKIVDEHVRNKYIPEEERGYMDYGIRDMIHRNKTPSEYLQTLGEQYKRHAANSQHPGLTEEERTQAKNNADVTDKLIKNLILMNDKEADF